LNQKLTRGIRSKALSPSFSNPEVETFQAQQSYGREERAVSNSDQSVDQKIEKKKEEVVSMRELQAGNSKSALSDYGIRSQSIVTNVYVNTLETDKETLSLERKKKSDHALKQVDTQSSKASQIDMSSASHYNQASDEMSSQNSETEVIVNGHEKGNVIVKRSIRPLKKLSKESKKMMANDKKVKKLSPIRHRGKRSTELLKQFEPVQKQDMNHVEDNENKIMIEKNKTVAGKIFTQQSEKESKPKLSVIKSKHSKSKEKLASEIKHNGKQVDTKLNNGDQTEGKQDVENKTDEGVQSQEVGQVNFEIRDEEIKKGKRDFPINHAGENKIIEKSKSLNNLESTSSSKDNQTSKFGPIKLKYQDSIRSTQSSNSQAASFGESVQSIQLSELGYGSLAYQSADDHVNHKSIRAASTMELRTQTDDYDPKLSTFSKLVDTSKSKLKSDPKCGHRLHYKSNPSGVKAVDVSHVTAKVDTKGYQIHHKRPTHSRQKIQPSAAEDEIFQKAEQGIHK